MHFFGPGIIEIECDAPPYSIVQACRSLGFRSPEDVRWCQQNDSLAAPPVPRGVLRFPLFQWLFGKSRPKRPGCFCGQAFPTLDRYTFMLDSGSEIYLFLGQCPRCSTLFWRRP